MAGEGIAERLCLILEVLLGLLSLIGAMGVSMRIPGTVRTPQPRLARSHLEAVPLSMVRDIMQAKVLDLISVLIAESLATTKGIALWRELLLLVKAKEEAKAVAIGSGSSGSGSLALFWDLSIAIFGSGILSFCVFRVGISPYSS